MELISVVEYATVVVTLILIASGAPVCIDMYKKRSTKNVPYFLFLISAFLAAICLHYGLEVKNSVLIFINIVSLVVWGLYASVYVLVSRSKTLPMLKMMFILVLYWLHLLYLKTVPAKDVVSTLGLYSMFWCTVAYVWPALEIPQMVKDKSAACCDLPLLLGGTLSAAVWYLYGVLLEDLNIYFPSIPALMISGIKLFLLFIYGSGAKVKVEPPVRTIVTGYQDPNVSTDFHKEVYDINARSSLRQRT